MGGKGGSRKKRGEYKNRMPKSPAGRGKVWKPVDESDPKADIFARFAQDYYTSMMQLSIDDVMEDDKYAYEYMRILHAYNIRDNPAIVSNSPESLENMPRFLIPEADRILYEKNMHDKTYMKAFAAFTVSQKKRLQSMVGAMRDLYIQSLEKFPYDSFCVLHSPPLPLPATLQGTMTEVLKGVIYAIANSPKPGDETKRFVQHAMTVPAIVREVLRLNLKNNNKEIEWMDTAAILKGTDMRDPQAFKDFRTSPDFSRLNGSFIAKGVYGSVFRLPQSSARKPVGGRDRDADDGKERVIKVQRLGGGMNELVFEATIRQTGAPGRHLLRIRELFWDLSSSPSSTTMWTTMEYADGGTLQDWIYANNQRRTLAECLDVIGQVLRGMADVHSHGFVHADLHGNNVLLRNSGTSAVPHVLISDFGQTHRISQGWADYDAFATSVIILGVLGCVLPNMRTDPAFARMQAATLNRTSYDTIRDKYSKVTKGKNEKAFFSHQANGPVAQVAQDRLRFDLYYLMRGAIESMYIEDKNIPQGMVSTRWEQMALVAAGVGTFGPGRGAPAQALHVSPDRAGVSAWNYYVYGARVPRADPRNGQRQVPVPGAGTGTGNGTGNVTVPFDEFAFTASDPWGGSISAGLLNDILGRFVSSTFNKVPAAANRTASLDPDIALKSAPGFLGIGNRPSSFNVRNVFDSPPPLSGSFDIFDALFTSP
jgi:serine/threonine protein kinase